jgi:hypothetical protein
MPIWLYVRSSATGNVEAPIMGIAHTEGRERGDDGNLWIGGGEEDEGKMSAEVCA